VSGSNAYSTARDVTHRQAKAGPGIPALLLFMCGTAKDPHKGSRTGAQMRGKLPMRCAACVQKDAK
jgi:hypothetical protein